MTSNHQACSRKMKAAITGGSGFIGFAIAKECLRRGQEVVLLDLVKPASDLPEGMRYVPCDVTDGELAHRVMDQERPHHLYLIAGLLGTPECNLQPGRATAVNTLGVANFMDLAVRGDLSQVFYVTKLNIWENIYTITKKAGEEIVQLYIREYELKGVIHRLLNAYGPRQKTHPVRKAVPYFILMALNDQPLEVYGDGEQTVDLIYVDDVARIAVEAMNQEHLTNDEVIDVGSGVDITINDLANTIIKLCQSRSEITHVPMRAGETPGTRQVANTTRLMEIMGRDFAFTNLEEGLLQTIGYYRQLPPKMVESALEFYLSEQAYI